MLIRPWKPRVGPASPPILRLRTPSTQVLNLATPGYNTVMEVARFVDKGWIRTFWLSQSDPHPNPLAHRIHAEAILEWLDTHLP